MLNAFSGRQKASDFSHKNIAESGELEYGNVLRAIYETIDFFGLGKVFTLND
ncbi:hypothetical protein [Paraburkholderia dinghuensis]|uniref:hypothetical protein n=1 Tax=Paraburkholderia dinghuensis TaxID=2305225 RepID=UPI001628188F|nr:hypothetical protein [Paraburkholderia dinghuensis]